MTVQTPSPTLPRIAPLWRWSLALLLVCGFAQLALATPPTETADGRLEQHPITGGSAWVLAAQPESFTRSAGNPEGDNPKPIDSTLALAAGLFKLAPNSLIQRGYLSRQVHLLPSLANTAPCSPRAPPPL